MESIGLIEALVALVVIMMGWLHVRQTDFKVQLDKKVDKEDFTEVKSDIKAILSSILDMKVENARWQGLVDRVTKSKPGSF